MIKPLPQNPLSGECGVMAIINALRLMRPELQGEDYESLRPVEELYRHLIQSMGLRLTEFQSNGSNGLTDLLREADQFCRRRWGFGVHYTLVFGPVGLSELVTLPAIVATEDHWVVVRRVAVGRAYFYDSYTIEPMTVEKSAVFHRAYLLEVTK